MSPDKLFFSVSTRNEPAPDASHILPFDPRNSSHDLGAWSSPSPPSLLAAAPGAGAGLDSSVLSLPSLEGVCVVVGMSQFLETIASFNALHDFSEFAFGEVTANEVVE